MYYAHIVFILTFMRGLHQSYVQSFKMERDIADNNEDVIKKRILEISQLVFSLPEDSFTNILRHTASLYIPVQAQSEECRNHSNYLLDSFLRGEMWALKMLDAGSKLVSGVLDGHLQDLGNYQECISIEEPGQAFRGQHCVIDTAGLLPVVRHQSDLEFSICVPSSCTVDDVATHIDLVLSPLNASTLYTKRKDAGENLVFVKSHLVCSTAEPLSFRLKDYFAMSFFSVIFIVVVASTIYDVQNGFNSGLSSFSLKSNFQGLVDTRAPAHEISCMNGIRVFCILSIMGYHRLNLILRNVPSIRFKTEDFDNPFMVVFNKTLLISVDFFFLLGGTVLGYNFIRGRESGTPVDIIRIYLNRYLRLTPLLAVVMLFYATLSVHTSQGPWWMKTIPVINEYPCVKYWWSSLLYISNYINPETTCIGPSWYLACDFQLHLLSPLLLLPLYKRPRLGVLLITGCILASVVGAAVNAYVSELYVSSTDSYFSEGKRTDASNLSDYEGIHFRAPPFLMGILLGYYLYIIARDRNSHRISKPLQTLGWTLCLGSLMTLTALTYYVTRPHYQWSPWLDPLYISLSKPLYSACIAWVIYICFTGHGGLVNQFFSWSVFRPLARLTYGMYLVHDLVIEQQLLSVQVPIAFSYVDYSYNVCGDFIFSTLVASIVYLLVEAPFSKITAKLLKGRKKIENSVSTKMTSWKEEGDLRK